MPFLFRNNFQPTHQRPKLLVPEAHGDLRCGGPGKAPGTESFVQNPQTRPVKNENLDARASFVDEAIPMAGARILPQHLQYVSIEPIKTAAQIHRLHRQEDPGRPADGQHRRASNTARNRSTVVPAATASLHPPGRPISNSHAPPRAGGSLWIKALASSSTNVAGIGVVVLLVPSRRSQFLRVPTLRPWLRAKSDCVCSLCAQAATHSRRSSAEARRRRTFLETVEDEFFTRPVHHASPQREQTGFIDRIRMKNRNGGKSRAKLIL